MKRQLVLGSGSASRRAILTHANIPFIIRKADIDEKAIGDRSIGTFDNCKHIVTSLGNAKADAILSKYSSDEEIKGKILVTADQIVLCNNKILEKPNSLDEARLFIQQYGSPHHCQTVGSIVLTDINTGTRRTMIDTSKIYFKPIPSEIIDKLIDEGEVIHCAGGLMIEHPLIQPYIIGMYIHL